MAKQNLPANPENSPEEHEDTTAVGFDASTKGEAADADDNTDPELTPTEEVGEEEEESTPAPSTGMTLHRGGRTSEALAVVAKPGDSEQKKRARPQPAPTLTNRSYSIKKVKVKDGLPTIEYDEVLHFDGVSPTRRAMTLAGGFPVHASLKKHFERLVPYLVHATQQLGKKTQPVFMTEEDALPVDYLDFEVRGVSLGSNEEGVTLTGLRTIHGTRVLNLVTPYIPFEGEQESWYGYASDVEIIVRDIFAEAVLVIAEGKGFNPQMAMFTDAQAS